MASQALYEHQHILFPMDQGHVHKPSAVVVGVMGTMAAVAGTTPELSAMASPARLSWSVLTDRSGAVPPSTWLASAVPSSLGVALLARDCGLPLPFSLDGPARAL